MKKGGIKHDRQIEVEARDVLWMHGVRIELDVLKMININENGLEDELFGFDLVFFCMPKEFAPTCTDASIMSPALEIVRKVTAPKVA